MQDHVGLGHLFQGGFERLDQLGGQAAHEADRVHVGVSASVAGFGAAHGRVQCGEQRVSTSSAEPVRRLVNEDCRRSCSRPRPLWAGRSDGVNRA